MQIPAKQKIIVLLEHGSFLPLICNKGFTRPKVTGEEEERSVFSGDGTLFGFEAAGWKERGRGELRVKVDQKGEGV